jgi:hypothetical protein
MIFHCIMQGEVMTLRFLMQWYSASQDAAESDDSPVHDATGSQVAQLPNAAGSFC